jgi:hypothetical protein
LKKIINTQIGNISKSDDNEITLSSSSWLSGIISVLSLTMLLFIFLYYEIYFLISILSIILIY